MVKPDTPDIARNRETLRWLNHGLLGCSLLLAAVATGHWVPINSDEANVMDCAARLRLGARRRDVCPPGRLQSRAMSGACTGVMEASPWRAGGTDRCLYKN
jgi:hypothetical protein